MKIMSLIFLKETHILFIKRQEKTHNRVNAMYSIYVFLMWICLGIGYNRFEVKDAKDAQNTQQHMTCYSCLVTVLLCIILGSHTLLVANPLIYFVLPLKRGGQVDLNI